MVEFDPDDALEPPQRRRGCLGWLFPRAMPRPEAAQPYNSSSEHLADELRRLDLILKLHLSWHSRGNGNLDGLSGVVVTRAQVDHLLMDSTSSFAGDDSLLRRDAPAAEIDLAIRRLEVKIQARLELCDDMMWWPSLVRLSHLFEFTPRGDKHQSFEEFAVLMALAPESDSKYGLIF